MGGVHCGEQNKKTLTGNGILDFAFWKSKFLKNDANGEQRQVNTFEERKVQIGKSVVIYSRSSRG